MKVSPMDSSYLNLQSNLGQDPKKSLQTIPQIENRPSVEPISENPKKNKTIPKVNTTDNQDPDYYTIYKVGNNSKIISVKYELNLNQNSYTA